MSYFITKEKWFFKYVLIDSNTSFNLLVFSISLQFNYNS